MRKNVVLLTASVMGMLALSACSSDNSIEEKEQVQHVPLNVTTDITTRSVITGTTFSQGAEIGVYALNASGAAYSTGSMNMRAQYDTKWVFPNGSIYLKSDPATVYAYYPYEASNSATTVPIDITYNSTNGQTDYLYGAGTATVNSDSPTAHIKFNHALARITFNVILDKESTGTNLLSNVTLRNVSGDTAVAVKGSMDIITGKITRTTNTYATIEQPLDTTLKIATASPVDMLVMPINVKGDMNVVMTIDDKMYTIKLPDTDLKAGNQYSYPVTVSVKNQRLSIGDCTITAWNSNSASNMDVTTDNYTISVPTAVDLGLSVKWASFNLGATAPEESGLMISWGSRDENNSITAPRIGDISGNSIYDAARAKLGGTWRMPTNSELSELANTDNCTWEWTTMNGVYGYKITSKKTGFENNSIFLPAAGYIYGTALSGQGTNGYYLSGSYYSYNDYFGYYYYGFTSTNRLSSNSETVYYRYSLTPSHKCPVRPVIAK